MHSILYHNYVNVCIGTASSSANGTRTRIAGPVKQKYRSYEITFELAYLAVISNILD